MKVTRPSDFCSVASRFSLFYPVCNLTALLPLRLCSNGSKPHTCHSERQTV